MFKENKNIYKKMSSLPNSSENDENKKTSKEKIENKNKAVEETISKIIQILKGKDYYKKSLTLGGNTTSGKDFNTILKSSFSKNLIKEYLKSELILVDVKLEVSTRESLSKDYWPILIFKTPDNQNEIEINLLQIYYDHMENTETVKSKYKTIENTKEFELNIPPFNFDEEGFNIPIFEEINIPHFAIDHSKTINNNVSKWHFISKEAYRQKELERLGLYEDATDDDITEAYRQEEIERLGLYEDATDNDITEAYRQKELERLGLPEDSTDDDIREVYRQEEALALGLPENATNDDITEAYHQREEAFRQEELERLELPEDATDNDITEAYRQKELERLGLPEDSTDDDIREVYRQEEALALGLPENATWEEILEKTKDD